MQRHSAAGTTGDSAATKSRPCGTVRVVRLALVTCRPCPPRSVVTERLWWTDGEHTNSKEAGTASDG